MALFAHQMQHLHAFSASCPDCSSLPITCFLNCGSAMLIALNTGNCFGHFSDPNFVPNLGVIKVVCKK
jgi:hypothetical protein